jgi:hypothetical protein
MSLWYPERGPSHAGQKMAMEGTSWCGMDNQARFQYHMSHDKTRLRLEKYGWLDSKPIEYRWNYQGFRTSEFDDRPAVIAIGCSHTMGTGLHQPDRWTDKLARLLDLDVWNLGVGGSGLDTQWRLLDHYIKILRPCMVVHAVPSINRFETYARDDWQPVIPNNHEKYPDWQGYLKDYYVNDENSETNARRNLMAIQHVCHRQDVPYFALDVMNMDLNDQSARDLSHPGSGAHSDFARMLFDMINHHPQGALDGHTRIRCS